MFLVIKPISDHSYEGLLLKGKPPKIKPLSFSPELTSKDLRGKRVFLLLNVIHFHYETYKINLPLYNPKLITLRLQERVRMLGLFRGSFDVYWTVLEREGNLYHLAYVALDSEEIRKKVAVVRASGAKLEGISFQPLTFAAFFSEMEGPTLLIHQEREGLWLLLLQRGIPLLMEHLPVDPIVGLNMETLIGRIRIMKRFTQLEGKKEVEEIYAENPAIVERLKQEGFQALTFERKFQEYLGIFQLKEGFNFLPPEERVIKGVLTWNYNLSKAVWGFTFLLTILFLLLLYENKKLKEAIAKSEAQAVESINLLLKDYPEPKLKALKAYLIDREKYLKSPQPAEILEKIVQNSPGLNITTLEIKVTQENRYMVYIAGERPGKVEELPEIAENIAKNYIKLLEIVENKFDFSQRDHKITFKIRGFLKNP